MRKFLKLASVLVLLSAGPVAWAQSISRVTGTVKDKSGAVVQGATVTLTNESTGVGGEQCLKFLGDLCSTALYRARARSPSPQRDSALSAQPATS